MVITRVKAIIHVQNITGQEVQIEDIRIRDLLRIGKQRILTDNVLTIVQIHYIEADHLGRFLL